MLRPEQLSVTACASHESPISILDVDFTGHLSTLTLGLPGSRSPSPQDRQPARMEPGHGGSH
jgi:iron(III) transport system ATP-binding protein